MKRWLNRHGAGKPNPKGRHPSNIIGEVLPEHQKYFYSPRASRKENGDLNDHPTVKPLTLMEYLVKIYSPLGTTVLDPFCGTGTTGIASVLENRSFIGIEMSDKYSGYAKSSFKELFNKESKVTVK